MNSDSWLQISDRTTTDFCSHDHDYQSQRISGPVSDRNFISKAAQETGNVTRNVAKGSARQMDSLFTTEDMQDLPAQE